MSPAPDVRVPALSVACATAAAGPTLLVVWLQLIAAEGVWIDQMAHPVVAVAAVLMIFGWHPASLVSLWSQTLRDTLADGRRGLARLLPVVRGLLAHPQGRALTVAQSVGVLVALIGLHTGLLTASGLPALP